MPMIDIGIEIKIATASGTTVPVAAWTVLKDCVSMPSLIQPSAKIPTDFIGDNFISEIKGKRVLAGLDFVFAFDGSASGKQFAILSTAASNKHWFKVKYPDGTTFDMLANFEVSLVAPTPSGQLDYTLSVLPIRNAVAGQDDYIIVTASEDASPIDKPSAPGQ